MRLSYVVSFEYNTTYNIGMSYGVRNSKAIFMNQIQNNLTTTSDGYVLDARQGKDLNDKIIISETGTAHKITKCVYASLTWDSSKDAFPIGNHTPPFHSSQISVVARNVHDGSLYLLWYTNGQNAFKIGYTIFGNYPSHGNEVVVSYFG